MPVRLEGVNYLSETEYTYMIGIRLTAEKYATAN